MKKKLFVTTIMSMVISVVMTTSAFAHWVYNYVPQQIMSQLQSLEYDAEMTRGQFAEDLLRLYEIINGTQMEQGGLYVAPFTDTTSNAPYILATQGIVNGMSEGIFAPNSTLTRAQCVAMVKRAMAPTRSGNGSFPDIQGHWAQPEIAWAAENNVVNGFTDGYFYPDQNLTVAQARKILYLAQKQFGWVGVESFTGGAGTGNSYYGNGSFSPTPQQGQGYTNPDGTWDSYNNGYYGNNYNNGYNNNYNNNYNNGYNDGYYNDSYYGDSFGQTPGYNNGYNSGYNNNYNGGSFSSTPANGGVAGNYTPSAPTNGGGF
jgi:hypothetical protein